jgi:hypothetical protein
MFSRFGRDAGSVDHAPGTTMRSDLIYRPPGAKDVR